MRQTCPLCGGETAVSETCADRFNRCLALEYEHPAAFGAVHPLTVLCYMLQHNAYTATAWAAARKMLAQFVHEGKTPAEMRRQNRQWLAQRDPASRLTAGEKLAEFETIVWSRTIADVRLDTPDSYCADINQWAQRVLADTAFLQLE